MMFIVEQKGQVFMVVNETTGDVKGRFKDKGEAEVHAHTLQSKHDEGVEQASGKLTPPADA